jgi:hypothetical protein
MWVVLALLDDALHLLLVAAAEPRPEQTAPDAKPEACERVWGTTDET